MKRTAFETACAGLGLLVMAALPGACSSPGTQTQTAAPESQAMADQALRDIGSRANPAVTALIRQADALIDDSRLDLAEEKIERALRISPDFAPLWSRLSRIALLRRDPARAIQMATRSNSFAGDDTRLKRLNWELIREARLALNDDAGVEQAEAAIRRLQ